MRYFTPGHEMNLCGHATIASLYCLHSKAILEKRKASTSKRRQVSYRLNSPLMDDCTSK
ncbi:MULTISPECIES: PhzF family phenazine biosynthesis protein [Paenibacillus]|uniref:PhzF family phenazine biosynthesis protein n=1 Tax=Paenibacillus alvei TaxID=44250 RepID=A0ABT4EDA6_PAEAL|nr:MULTISPECIES: PhzF family phenazine biosynthesis protein [Paenibacillus]MCY9531595.1 PhzF family phenazine biosynthesis protein [Paenibacillus alvei]